MGDIFGGSKTQKTTVETKNPQYITDAQQTLYGGLQKGLVPYLDAPERYVSPLQPGQVQFGQGAGELYGYARGTDRSGTLPDYASQFTSSRGALAPFVGTSGAGAISPFVGKSGAGGLSPYVGTSAAGTLDSYIPGYSQRAIDAASIDNADIAAFANPLEDRMLAVDARQRGEAYDRNQRDIGARAAAAGAFGGTSSGEALERAVGAQTYRNDAADAATKIAYDSYSTGAGLARGNADALTSAYQAAGNDIYGRAQGAAAYNANERQALFDRAQNAAAYDASQANDIYNRGLGSATYDAGERDALFNRVGQSTAFDRQLLGAAADYDLGRFGANESALNNYLTRSSSTLGLLGGFGDQQRLVDQQFGDRPYTTFSGLAPYVTPYQGTQVTTSPSNSPGLGQTALGAALTIGSSAVPGGGSLFGSLFS